MATKLYLKVNGIDGDASARGFNRWIDALSYSWANEMPAGSSLRSGMLMVTTLMGKHSVPLMGELATEATLGEVRLAGTTRVGGSDVQFLDIKLTGAIARAVDSAGSSSADYPAEVWSFAYSRVEMTYWTVANGSQSNELRESWNAGQF